MAASPWLIRDYRDWWHLPPPWPPRLPRLLWVVAAELAIAVILIASCEALPF